MYRPIVVADRLTKRFGSRLAVDEVSFSLDPGEVLGLLGPNGSGKSTILRLLIGYLRPTSGGATVAGHDVVADGARARAHLGYVPEDVPLYDSMRVVEFLRMMASLRGVRSVHKSRALKRVAQALELDEVWGLKIQQLSRGYRQRVAIAQALLTEPPLLIFDEPTNSLDPRQIIECRKLILSLAGRHAIIVTSHILSEVEKVADRAAILLDGRLLSIEDLTATLGVAPDLENRFLELTAP